jgi:WD40 repeat protein
MHYFPLSIILGCGILIAINAELPAQTCKVEQVIEGFHHPESVAFDGKNFYVSNLGQKLAPLEKDGDGYISRLTRNGALQDSNYFRGVTLHAPKGLAVVNEQLFVADVGRIVVLDIRSRKKIQEKDLSSCCLFVNDLAPRDEDRIFFSCSDKGTLWLWDIAADTVRPITDTEIPGANGLVWEFLNADLYVAGMGSGGQNGNIHSVEVKNNTVKILSDHNGMWDGLQLVRGRLLATDWKTHQIWTIPLRSGEASPLPCGQSFQGPADFLHLNGKLYLPAMKEGKLYILKISH